MPEIIIDKKEESKITTIEEIMTNLINLNITGITIEEGEIWKFSDKTVKVIYNDYNDPIVIKEELFSGKKLWINPKWYEDNKEKVNELIKYICENIKQKKFSLEKSQTINNEVIESLCKNKYIEELGLAKYDKDKYVLSEKDYQKFKKSTIKTVDTQDIEESLLENFDPLIGYNKRNLISYYDYHKLQKIDNLDIYNELKEEEINNFKYIPSKLKIKYNCEEYSTILKITRKLKELNKSNQLVIRINDKEKFNKWILNNNIDYDNVFIELGITEYPLKEYLKFEKILYDFVKGLENLSPFEKYIYIYNVTKKYKKYQENDEDRTKARNLYEILTNEYMVCVGFSNMLGDLLNKQNIENCELSVTIDISYDKIRSDEETFGETIPVEKGYHARRYVHIKDEKYGIDGFYIADPTWDNDLENDCYNYLAMTHNETSNAKRYLWTNTYNSDELLNVNSIEEFYQKLNFLTSRINKEHTNKELIREIINDILLELDKEYIVSLKEKYPYINEYQWPNDINDLIYEVGEYLVNHVNKEISGEVIIEAVSNVYKNAYGYNEEEYQEKIKETIKVNKDRHEKAFPIRYKITEEGTKEVIMNSKNKFDIEYHNLSK